MELEEESPWDTVPDCQRAERLDVSTKYSITGSLLNEDDTFSVSCARMNNLFTTSVKGSCLFVIDTNIQITTGIQWFHSSKEACHCFVVYPVV